MKSNVFFGSFVSFVMNQALLLTTSRAAAFLGISVASVQKLVDQGVLQAGKTPGGHRRIYVTSLEAYKRARFPFMTPLGGGSGAACVLPAGQEPLRFWVAGGGAGLQAPRSFCVGGRECVLEPVGDVVRLLLGRFDVLFVDADLGWFDWAGVCALAEERAVSVVLFKHVASCRSGSALALEGDLSLRFLLGFCSGVAYAGV